MMSLRYLLLRGTARQFAATESCGRSVVCYPHEPGGYGGAEWVTLMTVMRVFE